MLKYLTLKKCSSFPKLQISLLFTPLPFDPTKKKKQFFFDFIAFPFPKKQQLFHRNLPTTFHFPINSTSPLNFRTHDNQTVFPFFYIHILIVKSLLNLNSSNFMIQVIHPKINQVLILAPSCCKTLQAILLYYPGVINATVKSLQLIINLLSIMLMILTT